MFYVHNGPFELSLNTIPLPKYCPGISSFKNPNRHASWCEGLVDIACSSNFRTFLNTATDTYCDRRWSKLMPVLSFKRQQGKCHAWFRMHSNDFPLQCFIFKHAEFNYHSPDFLLLWRSLKKHLKLTQALNLGCQPMLLVQSLHFNFHLN